MATKKPSPPMSDRGQGRKVEISLDRFTRICESIAETGSKYASCKLHGFSYHGVRERCKADPAWQAMWDASVEEYRDNLEREAHRRAYEGWLEPVYYQGGMVGFVRKFSDRLLELRLRAELPLKYRDNVKLDATVTAGVLRVGDDLSEEEWIEKFCKTPAGEGPGDQGSQPAGGAEGSEE